MNIRSASELICFTLFVIHIDNHLERNLRYLFVAGGLISFAAFAASVAVALMFTSDDAGFRVAAYLGMFEVGGLFCTDLLRVNV